MVFTTFNDPTNIPLTNVQKPPAKSTDKTSARQSVLRLQEKRKQKNTEAPFEQHH